MKNSKSTPWRMFLVSSVTCLLLLTFDTGHVNCQTQAELDHRVRCDDTYCVNNQIDQLCLPAQNCTTVGYRKFLFPIQCNCCPYCYDYLEDGAACRTVSLLPNNMCGPLLQCGYIGNDEVCVPMTGPPGSCIGEFNAYQKRQEDGTAGIADFIPDCNAHGKYNPRQCLPASSICICMSEDGMPLFGMGFSNTIMDCACSRDADRLKSFGVLDQIPHCMRNGDYDQLQCFLRSRTCFCRMKPTDTVGMDKMKDLPCYNSDLHSEAYVRPCELARAKFNVLIYTAEEQNSTILISDFPRCDPDGNYAAIQSQGQKWICVDSQGDQIESFEFPKSSSSPLDPPPSIDCNCARVHQFLGDSAAGKPKCCQSGSYRPWQCAGNTCYCVDEVGRQDMTVSPTQVDRDKVNTLPCYVKTC